MDCFLFDFSGVQFHYTMSRKIIYNQYREDLIEIFKRLCSYKGVEIIEGHMMPDFRASMGTSLNNRTVACRIA